MESYAIEQRNMVFSTRGVNLRSGSAFFDKISGRFSIYNPIMINESHHKQYVGFDELEDIEDPETGTYRHPIKVHLSSISNLIRTNGVSRRDVQWPNTRRGAGAV